MGLDAVEMVMAIEEEFDINIPDEEAGNFDTVGKLYRHIVDVLYQSGCSGQVDESEVWERMKDVIVSQLGVRPELVTEDASFVADLGID
jgi:acyl carrier protein